MPGLVALEVPAAERRARAEALPVQAALRAPAALRGAVALRVSAAASRALAAAGEARPEARAAALGLAG